MTFMEAAATSHASGTEVSVTIVGGGSLGLVFAAALAGAGHLVTLLARATSAAALRDQGVIVVNGKLALAVPTGPPPARPGQVAVTHHPGDLPETNAVLFTSKGHDLPQSIEAVADAWPVQRREAAFVAGLQNGVVKDELLAAAFGGHAVVGAATVLGAERLSPGTASVRGLGTTFFGEFDAPSSARTDLIAAAFLEAGLPCVVVADVKSLLWAKFCNAIGVFGVSALTRLPSVEIFARPSLALAYRSLLDEAAAVAMAEGVQVEDFPDLPMRTYLEPPPEEAVAEMGRRVQRVPGQPPGYSSIAQDLTAGRRTEVEETFGDFLRRAHAHGVPAPRAELVYRILTGLWPSPIDDGPEVDDPVGRAGPALPS
jgi:2-dehydropantoate 2-reductase